MDFPKGTPAGCLGKGEEHNDTFRFCGGDENALTRAIITRAGRYGRYGYRRITVPLQAAGWQVGKDRVERIWRREGLKGRRRRFDILES